MASMRNVAGEILGSMAAVEKAIELGVKSVDIYFDYMGIRAWALGEWKRNKKGTIAFLASLSASSLPSTPECPLTLTKLMAILSFTDCI